MDVGSLRAYTRSHLEVDEEELPDALLNVYLQDAFERTMALSNRWPRYEQTWPLSMITGRSAVTLPPDVLVPAIMSVVDVHGGYKMAQINHENAEQTYLNGNQTVMTGQPIYYSVWGYSGDPPLAQLYLWPTPEEAVKPYSLSLRAYRQPVWSNGASTLPDLDPRMHLCLAYYAMGLVYAAQEDEILEGVYMARWQRDAQQQMKTILEPSHNRPLVMHGGTPIGGVPAYVINPPEL